MGQIRRSEPKASDIEPSDRSGNKRTSYREALDYWLDRLSGPLPILELPSDQPRPLQQSCGVGRIRLDLGVDLSEQLRTLARKQGFAIQTVLCAGWAMLLARLSGQRDLIIGAPTCDQTQNGPEVGESLKPMLPLRFEVGCESSLRKLFSDTELRFHEAHVHQNLPFQTLLNALALPIDATRHPVFQSTFSARFSPQETIHFPGLDSTLDIDNVIEPTFDLTLSISLHPGGAVACITYATDLFSAGTVCRWAKYLTRLLHEVATVDAEQCVGDIQFLPQGERQDLLKRFNETRVPFPQETPVHRLFEGVAVRYPDSIAVIDAKRSATYRHLDSQADHLARRLLQRGMAVGEYVPVIMPRSLELIITQLAILKCGGAYLPLDPALPEDRRTLIVKDSGARRIIYRSTDYSSAERSGLRHSDCELIDYELEIEAISDKQSEDATAVALPTSSPAYVIYTSGSTGVPKGVVVTHRGIVRLVINCGYMVYERTDRIAHCSNPAFDAATFELWGALLNGVSVVIIAQSVLLAADLLSEAYNRYQVTATILTTALFNQHAGVSPNIFSRLRYLLFGGEAADVRMVKAILESGFAGNLVNVYGPTETTTFATWFLAKEDLPNSVNFPIGRPISNTQIYILDSRMHLVPVGVRGEIYIGGPGVALGYLNRPDLAAERFVADPFSATPGARLYKSGDVARWQEGGIIEYCGRNDDQVKIRGFRIELGEISAQIVAHAHIRDAAVIARKDITGERRLVAYLVRPSIQGAAAQVSLDIHDLRARLREVLPDYMVPVAFVSLSEFPLTPNGKLDQRALPSPGPDDFFTAQYEAPKEGLEQDLSQIWSELLGTIRVSRHDNFFRLGGNSLQGMKLAVKMTDRFGVHFPPLTLFKAPVLHQMADLISRATDKTSVADSTSNIDDLVEGVL